MLAIWVDLTSLIPLNNHRALLMSGRTTQGHALCSRAWLYDESLRIGRHTTETGWFGQIHGKDEARGEGQKLPRAVEGQLARALAAALDPRKQVTPYEEERAGLCWGGGIRGGRPKARGGGP